MSESKAWDEALEAWGKALDSGVELDPKAVSLCSVSTLGVDRSVRAILKPITVSEVIALVQIATRYRIPLYPISIGNNWGYGSASPVVDGCVLVDLSSMNAINSFEEKLGLVTVEPGVTVGQLEEYLRERKASFISPTTGSGPSASLIGNALDHGAATSAYTDRFSTIRSLKVVLSDGTLYTSQNDGEQHRGFFKWGVGPYIDGLFGQSSLGIVVGATFALAPRPQKTEIFFLTTRGGTSLGQLVEATRALLHGVGSSVPSVSILHARRAYARLAAYPQGQNPKELIPPEVVERQLHSLHLGEWSLSGVLQGEPSMVRAARPLIRKYFKKSPEQVLFFSSKVNAFFRFLKVLPAGLRRRLGFLPLVDSHAIAAEGRSIRASLIPLWKLMQGFGLEQTLLMRKTEIDFDENPHCGFIHFTAVLPLIGEKAEAFNKIVEEMCIRYRIEPLLSYRTFSERCLLATLPILFDRTDPEEVKKAHTFYAALASAIRECGAYVYRVPNFAMPAVVDGDQMFWEIARRIKDALDPSHIISPGRYIPED